MQLWDFKHASDGLRCMAKGLLIKLGSVIIGLLRICIIGTQTVVVSLYPDMQQPDAQQCRRSPSQIFTSFHKSQGILITHISIPDENAVYCRYYSVWGCFLCLSKARDEESGILEY